MLLSEKHHYPFLIIFISSKEALIQEKKKSVYLEKVVAHIRPTFCCIWKSLLSW